MVFQFVVSRISLCVPVGIGLCPGADAWSESENSRYLAKKGLKKSGDPLRPIDGYDQAENSQPHLGKINRGGDGR